MPFHVVTNTTQVEIRYQISGVPCENVLHYRWASGVPPTEAQLLQLALDTWTTIVVKMANMSHTGVFFLNVYCRNLHTEFSAQATYTPTAPLQGLRTGTHVANQVAKSITKRTGITGRSSHGGMRLSGFDTLQVQENDVTPTHVAFVANLITSLVASRQSGALLPALASRTLGTSKNITSWLLTRTKVGSTDTRTE